MITKEEVPNSSGHSLLMKISAARVLFPEVGKAENVCIKGVDSGFVISSPDKKTGVGTIATSGIPSESIPGAVICKVMHP